jgi:hypothetical protein
MKHVSFCGLRLRALVVITALAAAALALASPALAVNEAATPFAGSFSKQPTQTSDNWNDSLPLFGAMAASECGRVTDPPATDLAVCSVHETNPTDDGTAEVVVTLDLSLVLSDTTPQMAVAVFRCVNPVAADPATGAPLATCTQIAFRDQSAFPDLAQLRVTFPVTGDNPLEPFDSVFYEVRVIPILIAMGDQVRYAACASYIGTGTDLCLNDERLDVQPAPGTPGVFPAGEFLTCTMAGNSGNRRLTGSGRIDDANGTPLEQVSVSLRQRSEKPNSPQGQINHRFVPTKKKFHSKKLACARFNDDAKKVEARGIGWTKVEGQKPRKVCFVSHFQDNPLDTNQKGTGDNFDITTVLFFRNDPSTTADDTCGEASTSAEERGGTLTKGNFRYRINDRGEDTEFNEYDRDHSYDKDSDYDWSYGG